MRVYKATDAGRVREKNEDFYYVSDNDLKLFIVEEWNSIPLNLI